MLFRSLARFAAKQVEGSAAKPSFFSRVATGAVNTVKVGTPLYSLGYGAAAGVFLSGVVYVGRTASILFFDHEYYKLQSRHRFYEKQLLFAREQDEANEAHYLAALAAEYDPAACRAPFKSLDAKYRF